MPDADGRIRPVVVPDVPWCRRCKLTVCQCWQDNVCAGDHCTECPPGGCPLVEAKV